MRLNDIPRLYSCWLSALIFGDKRHRYSKLLDILHTTPFRYVLDMDKNREMDGIALRYRFGHENDISDYGFSLANIGKGDVFLVEQLFKNIRDLKLSTSVVSAAIGNAPCSILEMMVALCIRCGEQIIDDIDIQPLMERMFMDMLRSLGLAEQTDICFDSAYCADILERFLDRRYSQDGRGGLFVISRPGVDMRMVDIWYQMCFYLDGLIF